MKFEEYRLVEKFKWSFTTVQVVIDTDGDGIPDDTVDDDDLDRYLDIWKEFLGTIPKDPISKPLDTDGDGEPNGDAENSQPWMDIEDDDDGYTDEAERDAGTDPLDPRSKPEAPPEQKAPAWVGAVIIIVVVIGVVASLIFTLKRKKSREKGEGVGRL